MSYPQETQSKPWWKRTWTKIIAAKILFLSILVHLLFVTGATVWIVQTIYNQPKPAFKGGEAGANQSTRAMEKKFTVQKKTKSMTAPLAQKRVTTTALSKVAVPELPAMPSTNDISPATMSAVNGMPGLGTASPSGPGGGLGGGGAGFTMFGFKAPPQTGTLIGVMYDTKQNKMLKKTDMNREKFFEIVKDFAENGYRPSKLTPYYKAPGKIYATQLFIPVIDANDGPRAFGVSNVVKQPLWIVFYTARISPPKTGVYRFVGFGDDVLSVRLDGKLALEWDTRVRVDPGAFNVDVKYHYDYGHDMVINGETRNNGYAIGMGHAVGLPMTLEAGKYYDLEIAIGETDGGLSQFQLFFQQEGVTYDRDDQGNPILPLLRFSNMIPDDVQKNPGHYPPFMKNGPIWACELATEAGGGSSLLPPRP